MAIMAEIQATTWEHRQKKTVDAVTDYNPLLAQLKKRGRVMTIDGGRVIFDDILYAQNSYVQTVDPAEEIVLGINQTVTAFQFSPKILVGPTLITELEKAQNQGSSAFRNLLKLRMQSTEATLQNRMEGMTEGDGTGNGGRDFGGLKNYISQTPTVGVVGLLDRAAIPSIRNTAINAVTTFGSATTSANIESRFRYVKSLIRSNAKNDILVLAGSTYYNALGDAASSKQRFVRDEEMAKMGFGDNLMVDGMIVVPTSGKQFSANAHIDADEAYFVNLESMTLKMYKGYDFTPLDTRVSVNQLVDVALIVAIGNLTVTDLAHSAVMFDT